MSEANDTGFYGQARLDKELILSLPPDDVWVTSACIKFWDYEDVEDFVAALFGHFGRNFYLEVQYHNTESQRELNKRIIRIHRESGIPLIMGCDSHYIYPKQAQDRTDYLVSKGLTYPQEEGWYLDYPDGDEAYRRFAEQCVLSDGEIRSPYIVIYIEQLGITGNPLRDASAKRNRKKSVARLIILVWQQACILGNPVAQP